MKKRVVSFIFLFIVLSSFFLFSIGVVSANYDIMDPPDSPTNTESTNNPTSSNTPRPDLVIPCPTGKTYRDCGCQSSSACYGIPTQPRGQTICAEDFREIIPCSYGASCYDGACRSTAAAAAARTCSSNIDCLCTINSQCPLFRPLCFQGNCTKDYCTVDSNCTQYDPGSYCETYSAGFGGVEGHCRSVCTSDLDCNIAETCNTGTHRCQLTQSSGGDLSSLSGPSIQVDYSGIMKNPGEPCTNDFECGLLKCNGNPLICGGCTGTGQSTCETGQTCLNNECLVATLCGSGDGYYCNSSTHNSCIDTKSDMEPIQIPCAINNYCDEITDTNELTSTYCLPKKQNGNSCNFNHECQSDDCLNQHCVQYCGSEHDYVSCNSDRTKCLFDEPNELHSETPCSFNTYCSRVDNELQLNYYNVYCLPKKSPGTTCAQVNECVFGTCTNGKCPCTVAHACPTGQTCSSTNQDSGQCNIPSQGQGCGSAPACTNGLVCTSGQCVGCTTTDRGITYTDHCLQGQTCSSMGTCVTPSACTGSGQSTCSVNQHCASGNCVPDTIVDHRIPCSDTIPCTGGKVCDETEHYCVDDSNVADNCDDYTFCASNGDACTDNSGRSTGCASTSFCRIFKLSGTNKAKCFEKLVLDKSCTKAYQCISETCTLGKCVSGATTCSEDSACASADKICNGASCVPLPCQKSSDCGAGVGIGSNLKRACYTRGGTTRFCKEVKCSGTPPVCEDQDHDGISDDIDTLVGDPNGISCASLGGIHCNGQCLDSQSPNEVTRERGCCVPVSSTVRAGCKDERFVAELGKSLNIVRTCINPPGTAKVEIKEGNNLVSADQATLAGFSSPSYTEQDYGCGGVEVTPDPKGQPVPGYGFLGIIFSSLLVGLYYLRKRD